MRGAKDVGVGQSGGTAGSADRTVRIWDATTGELVRALEGHGDWVNSVAWSPDGRRVATGSDDRTAPLTPDRVLHVLEDVVEVFEDVRGMVLEPDVGYVIARPESEDGSVLSHELLCVVGYPRVAIQWGMVDRTLDGVDQPSPFPLGECPESVVVQPPEENPLLTSVKRHEEAVLDVDQELVHCVLSHLTRVRVVVVRDRDPEIGLQPSDKVRRERIRVLMWSSMCEAPIDEGLRQRRDVHIVRQTPMEQGKEHETPSLCRLAHQLHHPENLREELLDT